VLGLQTCTTIPYKETFFFSVFLLFLSFLHLLTCVCIVLATIPLLPPSQGDIFKHIIGYIDV
jgi:hypothetical protein